MPVTSGSFENIPKHRPGSRIAIATRLDPVGPTGITTSQNTPITTINNHTGSIPNLSSSSANNHTASNIKVHKPPIGLPSFLLSNIQSFGNSADRDKTTELQAILDINKIDIACLTETWLTDFI